MVLTRDTPVHPKILHKFGHGRNTHNLMVIDAVKVNLCLVIRGMMSRKEGCGVDQE